MKGMKGLALSMVVILLCITTVIGGTFALFTDTVTVKNHLESGVLDATLIRDSATKVILGDDGYVKTENVGESDFTGANQDNVFGLELGDKIVPGSVLNANMKIIILHIRRCYLLNSIRHCRREKNCLSFFRDCFHNCFNIFYESHV